MENLEHRVYRAKVAQERINSEFNPEKYINDYEKSLDAERERAALIDYKNKVKGEFHIIEKVAYGKHLPRFEKLNDFLMPYSFKTVSSSTIVKKGRKWLADHLEGKSKRTLEQFMDEVAKHNKSEKDPSKRYIWDVVVLTTRPVTGGRHAGRGGNRKPEKIKNQFILRVKLSPANGLFIGIQDGQWCIFY